MISGYFHTAGEAIDALRLAGGEDIECLPISNNISGWLGRRRHWLTKVDRGGHKGEWYWNKDDPDLTGRARVYDRAARPDEHLSEVIDLLIGRGGPTAQLSILPDSNGYLIRVWAAGQTHEQGGTNSNCLSLVVKFDADDKPILDSFNWYGGT